MSEPGAVPGRSLIAVAIGVVAVLLPPVVYMAYVVRDSVNAIYEDAWNATVPLVHAALHHSLTIPMLWVQHNESRMLVPNIIFVLFGQYNHFDTRTIMLLSAALYAVGYWLLLLIWRPPLTRLAGATASILVGAVWFSFEDWENALWAFQLAWFLVALLLMVMLWALSGRRLRPWAVAAAAAAAALANFSLLQGLFLWPIGLICLLWRLGTTRRRALYCAAWIIAATASVIVYFMGYDFGANGNTGIVLRHPAAALQYFFAAVGNVYPADNHLRAVEIVGVVIVAAALWVCIQVFRRTNDRRLPLSFALIAYGIGFDLTITIGRLQFGVPQSLASRYTMANLLIVVGISVHFLSRHAAAHQNRRSFVTALTTIPVIVALFGQISVADRYGWAAGNTQLHARQMSAWVETNLNRLPLNQQVGLFEHYVYPTLTAARPLIQEARQDHLSVFYPPVYRYYRHSPEPGSA